MPEMSRKEKKLLKEEEARGAAAGSSSVGSERRRGANGGGARPKSSSSIARLRTLPESDEERGGAQLEEAAAMGERPPVDHYRAKTEAISAQQAWQLLPMATAPAPDALQLPAAAPVGIEPGATPFALW